MTDLTGIRILIIDDSEDCLTLFRIILEKSGASVITIDHALSAIRIAKKEQPDIILLDWYLPDIDGLEAFKLLKRAGVTCPVIMLTAACAFAELQEEEALSLGFSDYITKPTLTSDLIDRILKAIKGAAHDQDLVPR